MKKILSLLAILLLVTGFTGCIKKDTATLQRIIELQNGKCPVNLGTAGDVLSISYDDENRKVEITVLVNDDTQDLEAISADTELACRVCALTLRPSEAREFMREIVDTGSDVVITYRGRTSGKTAEVILSSGDIDDYLDDKQDKTEDGLAALDDAIAALQADCPCEIEEGITITGITKKRNNVIITCTLDEDICTIESFNMIATDVRNGILGLYENAELRNLVGALGPSGRGLVVEFTGSALGQTVEVVIPPAELS